MFIKFKLNKPYKHIIRGDINMIDSFHLEEYNVKAVNYNRDISAFPILKNILEKIKYPQFLYNWACFYSHAISIYFLKYMR